MPQADRPAARACRGAARARGPRRSELDDSSVRRRVALAHGARAARVSDPRSAARVPLAVSRAGEVAADRAAVPAPRLALPLPAQAGPAGAVRGDPGRARRVVGARPVPHPPPGPRLQPSRGGPRHARSVGLGGAASFTRVGGCDLCRAARITPWHHEEDICWIAECDVCDVPMVVWRYHGTGPPAEHVTHMHTLLRH